MPTSLEYDWRGCVGYAEAVSAMELERRRIIDEESTGVILLMEHPPVITLGRSANTGNILLEDEQLKALGVDVCPTTRGGDVTYHGPGQLMIYPIVRVTGVLRFLRSIADTIVVACEELGLRNAEWRRDPAGVWVDRSKLAACGIHLHRGVSIHGFALNVSTPANAWSSIVPCGLSETGVTSVQQELGGQAPGVAQLARRIGPMLVAALQPGCGAAKALP